MRQGLRFNLIMLYDVPAPGETDTILHEYAHSLVDAQGGYYLPRWYNGGMAEYLSSSRVWKDHLETGRPAVSDHWILQERWLSADGQKENARSAALALKNMGHENAYARQVAGNILERLKSDRPTGDNP